MSRIIEIVLFLTPFISFLLWRLLLPSPLPPFWLVSGLTGFVVLMVAGLLWIWHSEAGDANRPYIPDELRGGIVVPGHSPEPP